MRRKQELRVLIAFLLEELSKEYTRFNSLTVESFIEHYDQIAELQSMLANYIKELKELNK